MRFALPTFSLSSLALLGLILLCLAAPAAAETRTFIIANSEDGYGVDICLANGEPCGRAAANSYCSSQGFAAAAAFREAEVTGAIQPVSMEPGGKALNWKPSGWFSRREAYVSIDCTR